MSETPTQKEWWKLQADVETLQSDMRELKGSSKENTRQLDTIKGILEGTPPHTKGMRGELDLLRSDHEKFEEKFDSFREEYGTGQAERKGRWTGARLVWLVVVGMLSVGATILTLILNADKIISGAGG